MYTVEQICRYNMQCSESCEQNYGNKYANGKHKNTNMFD